MSVIAIYSVGRLKTGFCGQADFKPQRTAAGKEVKFPFDFVRNNLENREKTSIFASLPHIARSTG